MILEQLLAALQANTDALNRLVTSQGVQSAPMAVPMNASALDTAGYAQQQLAASASASAGAGAGTISAEAVHALIQPHISNEAIKADLGVAMRSLNINALGEAQPHQFGTLYTVFQGVLAKYGIGGQGVAPTPSASII